jgi:hypothetical protein
MPGHIGYADVVQYYLIKIIQWTRRMVLALKV